MRASPSKQQQHRADACTPTRRIAHTRCCSTCDCLPAHSRTAPRYARALHGFDQERIKYNGPITKEVIERASKGLVRYIDATGTPKPAPKVWELVVPKLLSTGSLLVDLNLSSMELDGSWAEVFGEAPLRCEMLRVLKLPSCKLRGALPTLQLPSLQTLYLPINQLTGGLEPLKGCTALQKLRLEGNQLSITAEDKAHFEKQVETFSCD